MTPRLQGALGVSEGGGTASRNSCLSCESRALTRGVCAAAWHVTGRSGKQCRERWHNQLDPNIKKDGWTDEEDRVLMQAHMEVCDLSLICLHVEPQMYQG
jgi:hypothetical protein